MKAKIELYLYKDDIYVQVEMDIMIHSMRYVCYNFFLLKYSG